MMKSIEKSQTPKKKKITIKKILLAVFVYLAIYTIIEEGPDIVRSISQGRLPNFIVDMRDGFVDGYNGYPPRY